MGGTCRACLPVHMAVGRAGRRDGRRVRQHRGPGKMCGWVGGGGGLGDADTVCRCFVFEDGAGGAGGRGRRAGWRHVMVVAGGRCSCNATSRTSPIMQKSRLLCSTAQFTHATPAQHVYHVRRRGRWPGGSWADVNTAHLLGLAISKCIHGRIEPRINNWPTTGRSVHSTVLLSPAPFSCALTLAPRSSACLP